ncbi:MAG: transcription initiation factor IIB family protein, partial [Candidatus Jordarchaeaceae archaeon]
QFLLYPNPISLRLLRADPQLAERGMRVVKYISQETVDEIRELSGLKGESKERLKRELELAKVEAERRRSSLLTKNSFSLTLEHKRLTEHGVEREILEGAKEIFLQAIKLTRRKYSKYIFYSSLYIAYRLSGIPISIKEIQSMGKLEPKRLVSTIRSLMESLKIRLPQVKPKELIFHNSKKLGVPQEIIQSAIDFAIIMGNTKHIRTKSPRSIAATALYLAFQQANRKITQKEIAAAFNVSDVTIRNLRKMWLVHSGQFIQKRS